MQNIVVFTPAKHTYDGDVGQGGLANGYWEACDLIDDAVRSMGVPFFPLDCFLQTLFKCPGARGSAADHWHMATNSNMARNNAGGGVYATCSPHAQAAQCFAQRLSMFDRLGRVANIGGVAGIGLLSLPRGLRQAWERNHGPLRRTIAAAVDSIRKRPAMEHRPVETKQYHALYHDAMRLRNLEERGRALD